MAPTPTNAASTRRGFLLLGGALAAAWSAGSCRSAATEKGTRAPATPEESFEVWKAKAGRPYERGRIPAPGVCALPGPNKKHRFPDPDKYKTATKVHGMCQLCSTVCGITGWVKDGRIVKVDGNPNDPSSRGRLCARGQSALNHQYHPERLLYPIRRVGKRGEGKWKRITWEEAYAELADRLRRVRESGHPERFAFHQGRNRSPDIISAFLNAYGTPTQLSHRSLCSAAIRAGNQSFLFETDWDLGDFESTKYILNFGSNVFEAHQGHVPAAQRVQRGRFENGAKLVTFDVRVSNTAGNSDEHFMPFPGTDGAIALAMAHVMVTEGLANRKFVDTWSNVTLDEIAERLRTFTPEWAEKVSTVPAKDIARIAREFAAAAPRCTTLVNRGATAHLNGFYNVRSIVLLNLLAGNLGKKGGFCWMYTGAHDDKRFTVPKAAPAPKIPSLLADPPEFVLANTWSGMKVGQIVYHFLKTGRAALDVYMTYNLDAPMTWPEMELTREVFLDEAKIPFHVSINPFYNETAHFADLVLPWTTFMERWDVDARGAYNLKAYLSMRRPMTEPLGEAKDLREILPELARRIGGGMEEWFSKERTTETYMAEWTKNVPYDKAKYDSPMAMLADVGAFEDPAEKPYYEPYLKPLSEKDMEGASTDPKTGIVTNKEGKGIGIIHEGRAVVGFKTPSRKFEVRSEFIAKLGRNEDVGPLAGLANSKAKNRAAHHKGHDVVVHEWPTYVQIEEHANLGPDDLVMTSFKWNVHNNGRTANLKWLSELVHSNPAWIHPETAKRHGLSNGDWIEITAFRSKTVERNLSGLALGSGELPEKLRIPVLLTAGIHPRVVAISTSLGHFQYTNVARARRGEADAGPDAGTDPNLLVDDDWRRNMWWEDRSGGDRARWSRNTGHGWAQNVIMPISPDVVTGQQSFNDTVIRIRKLA